MFDTCVLGVDPGMARLGLAVVARQDRRPVIVWSGTVETSRQSPEAVRLHAISECVRAAIAEHRPVSVALERVAWNVNKASAMAVARATGVVMAAAAEAGVPVEEYGSLEVKNAITGSGSADKAQIRTALIRVHGLSDVPTQPDAADAVAIAVTHLVRSRFAAGRGSRGSAMISFLEGEVVEKAGARVVVDVGGIGYDVLVPTSTLASLPPVGRRARIHTRMIVRDDAMLLYGFGSPDERELFDLLTGVTGVGPKVALAFLSSLSPDALRRSVVAGDIGALTVVPGVGKKVAQRVVLDLRDRMGGEGDLVVGGPLADVREALLALGLTPLEASSAMADLEVDGRAVDELLKEALQRVGR